MTRSSRHKSSKHSSKESREYSDSEKDSSIKDRKSKDESCIRVSKESNSGEKRKVESKDASNGDYVEEYNLLKRRKEEVEIDRWNGEGVRKKSGEGKHSGKRDAAEKKGRGAGASKLASHKTDSDAPNLLQNPDSDNQHDRQNRRKRDGSGDGDRHHDNVDGEDRAKDMRSKADKHKDDRLRDKYHEDLDRENRHREDKQRDERAKDRVSYRSDEKRTRYEKDAVEIRQKKSIPQDGEHDHDCDYDIGRDGNRDREYIHRDSERDRDRKRDSDRDHLHDRDRDLNRERDNEHEQEQDRDFDRNTVYDSAYLDDRSARYKDRRGKKRSSDDFDDYDDGNRKGIRNSVDNEKKSSSKVEPDADRGRSQTRQSHGDSISKNRRRLSPSTSSHGASDDYRSSKAEDSKYKDSHAEQRTKATSSREVTTFSSDRVSKYKSSEKPIKMEDGTSVERSSSSKASPKGLADRSPSSSLERRYMNKNSMRQSVEAEESGRRSRDSVGERDFPSAEDRSIREMPLDESLPSDTSFCNRSSQSNSALLPPASFRGGGGSPSFVGSVEEDGRVNSSGRYKRSSDPASGRGQGNAWRGAHNWSSHVPNGYIPFQHGPSHGGFQAMMPQFPSPPIYGIRPPMDMNHSGIPYHMADADRFHLRPLGWQNMMDASGPAHMHGWDGNNGVLGDEAHFYGGTEWNQNRHHMNGRGWDSGADMWKGQNGDLPSTPVKEDATVCATLDDVVAGQTGQKLQESNNNNDNGVQGKDIETKLTIKPEKECLKISSKTPNEKIVGPCTKSSDESIINVSNAYLSKLDISEKLASPELFKQGISLLNKEEMTNDSAAAMLVNLKDGARVVAKGSNTLWSFSLFPATNNSVFQRALKIYKKQRACVNGLPIANGRKIDLVLASNIKEEVGGEDVGKMEWEVRCNKGTGDACGEKAEVVVSGQEKWGEIVGNCDGIPLELEDEEEGKSENRGNHKVEEKEDGALGMGEEGVMVMDRKEEEMKGCERSSRVGPLITTANGNGDGSINECESVILTSRIHQTTH